MKKMIAAVALTACAMPAISMAAVVADVAAYGSYGKISADSGGSAKGGGGGLRARVNLPMTGLFATGEYQTNKLKDDGSGAKANLNDGRVGFGAESAAGPVSALVRVEYVHLETDPDGGSKSSNHGFGAHVGADAGIGIAGVYGSLGYLRLSDSQGPELVAGARVSIFPLVSLFGEYRYTKFNERDNSGVVGKLNDYRAGVNISF